MVMKEQQKEQKRRRERLKIFAYSNQWMNQKTDIEQSLSEMTAQLRTYRMELSQLRMREAATEAKIDRLQKQVENLECAIHGNSSQTPHPDTSTLCKITRLSSVTTLNDKNEYYYTVYNPNGIEQEEKTSTFHIYA